MLIVRPGGDAGAVPADPVDGLAAGGETRAVPGVVFIPAVGVYPVQVGIDACPRRIGDLRDVVRERCNYAIGRLDKWGCVRVSKLSAAAAVVLQDVEYGGVPGIKRGAPVVCCPWLPQLGVNVGYVAAGQRFAVDAGNCLRGGRILAVGVGG